MDLVSVVIGTGNIGSELIARIRNSKELWLGYKGNSKGFEGGLFGNSEGPKVPKEVLEQAKIAFLAIPTKDDGKAARDYILQFVEHGIPVVTCEKGAMSRYYEDLQGHLDNIGFSAVAGGGSGIIPYLMSQMSGDVSALHMIINGTLNYNLHNVGEGAARGAVWGQAVKLGYAEPIENGSTMIDGYNGEAVGDVSKKVSSVCNLTGICHAWQASDFLKKIEENIPPLEKEDFRKLMREAAIRRNIVSITREPPEGEDVICGYIVEQNGWYISGGFKDVSRNATYQRLLVPDVFNAAMVVKGPNGEYGSNVVSGEGAGPGPTAQAMLTDAKHLLKEK